MSKRELTALWICCAVSYFLSLASVLVATRGWGNIVTGAAIVVGVLSLSTWLTTGGALLAEAAMGGGRT